MKSFVCRFWWASVFAAALIIPPLAVGKQPETWVLRASRIYTAPDAVPIESGAVVVERGRIKAVLPKGATSFPKGVPVSECSGGVVTAGFQNSHVHFIETRWNDIDRQSAEDLSVSLTEMLTAYGFTTVVDIGSNPANTLALRRRIDSRQRDIPGPRILTSGLPIFPHDGLPFYMRDLPATFVAAMPQPATPEAALAQVRQGFDQGNDVLKLMVVSPQTGGRTKSMQLDIAAATAKLAHERKALVFAHPTNIEGIHMALDAGVDVLAHTTLGADMKWDGELLKRMTAQNIAVIPTLQLWGYELARVPGRARDALREIDATVEQLRAFASAGGQVLFGTDVGYMTDYDPTPEYVLMKRAGMEPMQILASLTTAPAARWNESKRRGRIAPGMDADLVVLEGDPGKDVRNFGKVRCAFREGAPIFITPVVLEKRTSASSRDSLSSPLRGG